MMKKIIIGIVFILLLAIGFILVRHGIGDLRPAFFPPSENISEIFEESTQDRQGRDQTISTGDSTNFPLDLPDNFRIGVFADSISGARDLEFSPEGVLLVSAPSQGKIFALPDANNDGKVDEVKNVITGLNRPHGIAFYQGKLYVAELRSISVYNWDGQNLRATLDRHLFSLPYNGGHNTRSIIFTDEGKMLVSLGSSCNVCVEDHPWIASVIVSDSNGNNPHIYSKGLRNAVFLQKNPQTGDIWVTEMGRDFLGDNLPPDEINILEENGDFGWPYCYGDKIADTQFSHQSTQYCPSTISPIYQIQAHSAPLGLAFIHSDQFPSDWQGDLLVSYHGSWNRSVPTGYKVVRINLDGDRALGEEDFLTGFLQNGSALGRPVDLIFDSQGSLYISDDKAGVVYKVIRN